MQSRHSEKKQVIGELGNLPKITELRNGSTMIHTQASPVSRAVNAAGLPCAQLQSRLIQTDPPVSDNDTAFPLGSTSHTSELLCAGLA